jgi:hypothetical protein
MTDTNGGPSRGDFAYLSEAVKKLTRTMESFQTMMAETYVRKDVYLERERLHDRTHHDQDEEADGLKDQINGLKSNNQWIWRALVSALLPVLVSAIVMALIISAGGRLP